MKQKLQEGREIKRRGQRRNGGEGRDGRREGKEEGETCSVTFWDALGQYRALSKLSGRRLLSVDTDGKTDMGRGKFSFARWRALRTHGRTHIPQFGLRACFQTVLSHCGDGANLTNNLQ